jgi:hypothetical protein
MLVLGNPNLMRLAASQSLTPQIWHDQSQGQGHHLVVMPREPE